VGWVLIGLGSGALLLGCVLLFPRLLYPPLSDRDLDQQHITGKDRVQLQQNQLKLQNDARVTLLQALGGTAILLGAYFTYRQVQTGRQQLDVARQGQVTERFTRAIDQLGKHEQSEVVLGGIYALERIARDSPEPKDRGTIAEVLTAYVRAHARWPPPSDSPYDGETPISEVPELQVRNAGVQAAMTVLGRGDFGSDKARPLDLHEVDLRKADLNLAKLQGMNFTGANLQKAQLAHARLEGARLLETILQGANLTNANLDGANLRGANLQEAILVSARLLGAYLRRADLRNADLQEARANDKTRWPEGWDLKTAKVRGVQYVD
jgi:hypothetical protein